MAKEAMGRLKALSHPLRGEILSFLNENGPSSPAEMERAGVGSSGLVENDAQVLSKIAYHCRILAELDCIASAEAERAKGSTEPFYRGVARMLLDADAWAKVPEEAKNRVSIAALNETFSRASTALQHAVLDSRNERNIINLGVHLDEQAFKQASQKMHDFIEFFDQLQAESLERVADPSELIPTSASLLMYESPKGKKSEQ